MKDLNLYGILIEFSGPEQLLRATEAAYQAGFRQMDAYTPYPIEDLAETLGFKRDWIAPITLFGGIGGGIAAFGMQWYANVIDYPISVGGRPDFSWPAFIPVTFELTVLGAALCAAFGMLALNRLPQLWHPVFNLPDFSRASRDRFFLCIQAKDPQFKQEKVRELMKDMNFIQLQEIHAN